jgi:AcrR family transcriptional regulator
MARPVTISDEQILEAAREVFLQRGMSATTAEVAKLAGVSEGIIFKRFGNKAELFRTAMHPVGLATVHSLETMVGQGEIEAQLEEIGATMIELFRNVVPMAMMSWSNAHEAPPMLTGEPMPVRGIKGLAKYFGKEMALGRMPKRDPLVLARTFSGAIWHFVMLELIIPPEHAIDQSPKSFVKGLVELALAPSKQKKTAKKKSRA